MEDLLHDIQQIDGLLARCVSPALTRAEHDSIREAMRTIAQRVKLSYQLEKEKAEAQKAEKEVEKDKGEA